MKKLSFLAISYIVFVNIGVHAMELHQCVKKLNLHQAAITGNFARVKELLTYDIFDVDVNKKNLHNSTPLHCAVENEHLEVVKILLKEPTILVNEKDITGSTPLHCAVETGDFELVEALLNHSAIQIDEKNKQGLTALHLALRGSEAIAPQMAFIQKAVRPSGSDEITRLLVLKGANTALKCCSITEKIIPTKAKVVQEAIRERNQLLAQKQLKATIFTLCAGLHPWLGKDSPLRYLNENGIQNITQYLHVNDYLNLLVTP